MPGIATKLASIGVALFLISSARDALAGPGVTVVLPNPARVDAHGAAAPTRDLGRNSNGISFDDCEKDVSLEFTLAIAIANLPTADVLQVWAGFEDCTQTAARAPATGTCQPVSIARPIQSTTMTVAIRGRDLAAIQGQASPAGSGGVAPGFETSTNDASCFAQRSSAGAVMNIAFIAFTPGASDADSTARYKPPSSEAAIIVDTVGPLPPTAGVIERAATSTLLTWTPSGDVDTWGFRAFCAPTPGACPSDALAAHLDGRTIDAQYVCANVVDRAAAEVAVSGLDARARYTFAVSGVDLSGNIGAATLEGCADPGTSAGGDAGAEAPSTVTAGCICSSHATSARGSTYGAALALFTIAAALFRRRRQST
jgi:MYXO-CTERM domain-containing protein